MSMLENTRSLFEKRVFASCAKKLDNISRPKMEMRCMKKEKRAQKERPKEKMPPHMRMQERHSNGKKEAIYIIRCRVRPHAVRRSGYGW